MAPQIDVLVQMRVRNNFVAV